MEYRRPVCNIFHQLAGGEARTNDHNAVAILPPMPVRQRRLFQGSIPGKEVIRDFTPRRSWRNVLHWLPFAGS